MTMRAEEPKRWLWIEEMAQGPYTVARMYKMAMSEDIGSTTLFWSEVRQQWFSLAGIMFDIEPGRLDEMASAGIEKITVLPSGQDDCEACATLCGKDYSIAAPPILPPADCSCVPWCRLTLIAAE